jgi:hypothetical protein
MAQPQRTARFPNCCQKFGEFDPDKTPLQMWYGKGEKTNTLTLQ